MPDGVAFAPSSHVRSWRRKTTSELPNGIADVRANVPFEILIANFSLKEVKLNRKQIVAQGMRTSQTLQEMAPQVSRDFVSTILAMPVLDGEADGTEHSTTGTPSDREDDSKPIRLAPLHENLQPDEEDWRNKVKLKHLNDE